MTLSLNGFLMTLENIFESDRKAKIFFSNLGKNFWIKLEYVILYFLSRYPQS